MYIWGTFPSEGIPIKSVLFIELLQHTSDPCTQFVAVTSL